MKKILSFVFISLVATMFSPSATADAMSWEEETVMPEVRSQFGSVSHNDEIYVFPGKQQPNVSNTMYSYNVTTKKWSDSSVTPVDRYEYATIKLGTKVYLMGGKQGSSQSTSVDIYDLSTKSWSKGSDAPASSLHLSEKDGKIYAYVRYTNDMYIYDPSTDSWMLSDIRVPHTGNAYMFEIIDQRMMIHYGGNRNMFIYDFGSGEWTSGIKLPEAISNFTSLQMDGQIYLIGGTKTLDGQTTVESTAVYSYDLQTGRWLAHPSLKTARYGYETVVVNNELYSLGGMYHNNDYIRLDSVEVLTEPVPEYPDCTDATISNIKTGGQSNVIEYNEGRKFRVGDGSTKTTSQIEGVIKDKSGVPIPNAQVTVWTYNPSFSSISKEQRTAIGTTDANGYFNITAYIGFGAGRNDCMLSVRHFYDIIDFGIQVTNGPSFQTKIYQLAYTMYK